MNFQAKHVEKNPPKKPLQRIRFLDSPKERPPVLRRITPRHGENGGHTMDGGEEGVWLKPAGECDLQQDEPFSTTHIGQASNDLMFGTLKIVEIQAQTAVLEEKKSAHGPYRRPGPLAQEIGFRRDVLWISDAERREILGRYLRSRVEATFQGPLHFLNSADSRRRG